MADDQQNQKVYCGNAKVIKTQYGELTRISLSADDVQKMQDNLDNGWINIVIKERRSPSPSGLTHYLEVDTWKPSGDREGGGSAPAKSDAPAPENSNNNVDEISAEDLPF